MGQNGPAFSQHSTHRQPQCALHLGMPVPVESAVRLDLQLQQLLCSATTAGAQSPTQPRWLGWTFCRAVRGSLTRLVCIRSGGSQLCLPESQSSTVFITGRAKRVCGSRSCRPVTVAFLVLIYLDSCSLAYQEHCTDDRATATLA